MSETSTRKLNRQIAEALGYTDLERRTYWEEDPWSGSYEVEYWHGKRPNDTFRDYCPNWADDPGAALRLLPYGRKVDIKNYSVVTDTPYAPPRWWVAIEGSNPFTGETLAIAICRAFLGSQ